MYIFLFHKKNGYPPSCTQSTSSTREREKNNIKKRQTRKVIILHLLCLLSLSMIKSTYRSESNPPLLWLSFHKLIEVLNVFDRFQWSLIAHHVSQLMRDISTHSRYQHTYYTNKINRNSRAAANRSTHVCTSRWKVCSLSREHRKLNGPISSSSFRCTVFVLSTHTNPKKIWKYPHRATMSTMAHNQAEKSEYKCSHTK